MPTRVAVAPLCVGRPVVDESDLLYERSMPSWLGDLGYVESILPGRLEVEQNRVQIDGTRPIPAVCLPAVPRYRGPTAALC